MNRRPFDRRWPLGVAALCAGVLAWALLLMALFWSTLDALQREQLGSWAAARWPLALLGVLGLVMAGAAAVRAVLAHFAEPAARLAEEGRVLANTDVERLLSPTGSREIRALADVINQLVARQSALRRDIEARVQAASANLELEKSRLAALMAELVQSVVVCNLDGRILLYNQRAREQFQSLTPSAAVGGGAELMGLGRSIYTVFDRKLVAHALETLTQRMLRDEGPVSAQFVTTTTAGRLLRVQIAPVRPTEAASTELDEGPALTGFVLMLDDITSDHEQVSKRDVMLHELTERSRAALANIQAALDVLTHPELEPAARERFVGVIRDETRAMGQRIATLEADVSQHLKTRWPAEDMWGADLVGAAARRIESMTGLGVNAAEVDNALWLRVESFSLLQALVYLAGRLRDEFGVRFVDLRLSAAVANPGRAHLDLVWTGQVMSTETVMSWELDPMRAEGIDASGLSVRDVVQRHGGAFWFERERTRHQAFFRLLLPLAERPAAESAALYLRSESRPEFYDFDLFQWSNEDRSLDDRRLTELAFTVFDTETTGLAPAQGDEIIQVGAVRIVNGKLLRQECFDQLIDPGRPIPASTIPIHGIEPAMVAGQPRIEAVLPVFHTFCLDTVLVAHNAAFDMRFLQLKQQHTGVVFDQPVLDTLLLSAVLHPNQESHRLEAIAERFHVPVIGRHTALGDAMVTAEVFLKLLPLLAERGIHTLGQAREASQKTYYARLKY